MIRIREGDENLEKSLAALRACDQALASVRLPATFDAVAPAGL